MSCEQIGSRPFEYIEFERGFSLRIWPPRICIIEKKKLKSVARFIGLGFTGAAREFNNVIRKFTAVL